MDRIALDVSHGFRELIARFEALEQRVGSVEHHFGIMAAAAAGGAGQGAAGPPGAGPGPGPPGQPGHPGPGPGTPVGGSLAGMANMGPVAVSMAGMTNSIAASLPASMAAGAAVVDSRLTSVEARMAAMETRVPGLEMPLDDEVDRGCSRRQSCRTDMSRVTPIPICKPELAVALLPPLSLEESFIFGFFICSCFGRGGKVGKGSSIGIVGISLPFTTRVMPGVRGTISLRALLFFSLTGTAFFWRSKWPGLTSSLLLPVASGGE